MPPDWFDDWVEFTLKTSGNGKSWPKTPEFWDHVARSLRGVTLPDAKEAVSRMFEVEGTSRSNFAKRLRNYLPGGEATQDQSSPSMADPDPCSICGSSGLVTCVQNDGSWFDLMLPSKRQVQQAHAIYSCTCGHGDKVRRTRRDLPDLRAVSAIVSPILGWPEKSDDDRDRTTTVDRMKSRLARDGDAKRAGSRKSLRAREASRERQLVDVESLRVEREATEAERSHQAEQLAAVAGRFPGRSDYDDSES